MVAKPDGSATVPQKSSRIRNWTTEPDRRPMPHLSRGSSMKIIGLIGGMSWESTVPYYRAINEAIKARLGGLHSAKLVLYSVDFHDIERLQQTGDWDTAGSVLAD